jgi:Uma2 family endonuclease
MPIRSQSEDVIAPDDRLVASECGYEIIDGQVVAVSPAHEPHGSRHSKLSALLEAYTAEGFNAASDMLTRTATKADFAPDGSIYPIARDPRTGGRQLEVLAFEVVSSESLVNAARKAASLVARGVRRVFAIDVERQRALEWSVAVDGWEMLANDAAIEDVALVLPLRVHDLVTAASADDAVARALLAKGNPVVGAALDTREAETKANAIITVLRSRGLAPTSDERERLLAMRSIEALDRLLERVGTCSTAASLFDDV